MNPHILREAAKIMSDHPETSAKLCARAAILEAGVDAERRRRATLEACEFEVNVQIGDLARLLRIADKGLEFDEAITDTTVQRMEAKISAVQLELLGWEGEVVHAKS
jgi:hypothetical protein